MIHHNECPLCSSDKISLHLRCTDHFLTREVFELFRCVVCGFIFTQDHPEDDNLEKYYKSDDYISHDDKATGFLNRIYLLAREIMLRRKREIIKDATGLRKGNLLDIGSGTGHFLETMKNAGWLVTGVESNRKASDFSVEKYGLNIIDPGQISELSAGSFDCITLWHVLEHLDDPFTYADEFLRLLKPGGSCIAAMPNSNSFDAEYYREFWAAYDVPRHLWHFTPDTFSLFSEKTGFVLLGKRNLLFDVFYISILSEKYKGSKSAFAKGVFIGKLFWILSAFRNEKSSSVIYLLSKPDH
ncbi:MAG TPA: class I SAM-dependent methyltransferase [Bacteroidales bacterium]|nr:class I SAM-dependent methyltransferase [Bacteroidales bacterium]HUV01519.1 class I SAM-dependent methyltransferase [Bacteroidales bacterium]